MKRRSIGSRRSKRMFTKHASKTHSKNVRPRPLRGGIRL